MIDLFQQYLIQDGKSANTIKGYIQSISGFLKWFEESKGVEFSKLHRENVVEYISFLQDSGQPKIIFCSPPPKRDYF